MSDLSKHQRAALEALVDGSKTNAEIAVALALKPHVVWPMMRTLQDRGLARCLGRLGARRQKPAHFSYELTDKGRALVEKGAA